MGREFFVVDRIEGKAIVLESYNGEIIVIEKEKVNKLPNDGDVLIKDNDFFYIDKDETIKRKEKIKNITKGIWA
ncbi:Protein of uncharacterised function (DUF3006) [uncultured Clostridium sp.]|uniref:DUF3006 domain-containing protein n=1 Tax=uncultured Clostridium sp. TaxID=59620 RepID=UPI00082338C8|nr:DUF3006 domain-containing protein [uncultured Clostridium sp.]SCJ33322.1 Protein of uncharacterised function (DUF3006) [uncultured Clostridium sp.]